MGPSPIPAPTPQRFPALEQTQDPGCCSLLAETRAHPCGVGLQQGGDWAGSEPCGEPFPLSTNDPHPTADCTDTNFILQVLKDQKRPPPPHRPHLCSSHGEGAGPAPRCAVCACWCRAGRWCPAAGRGWQGAAGGWGGAQSCPVPRGSHCSRCTMDGSLLAPMMNSSSDSLPAGGTWLSAAATTPSRTHRGTQDQHTSGTPPHPPLGCWGSPRPPQRTRGI